ncbi:transglycosylase domain-containing protein [Paenibacillus sp. y28]|uniref:transglycosylase domain-containing protein n=1 Tax=Paenibacillus sp. y28 TaxID=3129110 RepID=UPI00301B1D47
MKKGTMRSIGRGLWFTIKWAVVFAIVFGFLGAGIAFGYVSALVKDDPVRSRDEIMQKMEENSYTGFAYFRDDTVIGQLRSEEDRRVLTLEEIPPQVKDAFLAIEDNDFYEHPGVDVAGLFRAVKQRLLHENVQTGGSTITQQLARRVFLSLDRTDSRKFKEIFLSLRLERVMTKNEIFLHYLTKIPFGNGSSGYNLYGVKAAAKGIFNIDDLSQLNIAQSAYLAGLPQQPSTYSAYTSKGEFDETAIKKAITRQQLVLKRMQEIGTLTPAQYQEALAFDIRSAMAAPSRKAYSTYPFLMLETERQAADILLRQQNENTASMKASEYNEAMKDARDQLLRGGYKVYTTIDKTIYDEMKAIGENKANFAPDDATKGMEQLGAIMIENKTGAILGMIEGRDFYTEQMNHATQMQRQPGSTMKPIAAYLPAIEKGTVQPATIIDDVPIVLKDGAKGVHLPENWDYKYHGLVTARTALEQSYNIPAIKVFLQDVGIKEGWDFTRKLGITSITDDDYKYAQTGVIGGLTYGVSVQELTGAYTSIPNKGVFNPPYMIRKIVDAAGKTVYEQDHKPVTAFSEETAYIMYDMLRSVVTSGTAADLPKTFKHYSKVYTAGKTGSTQDDADAWYMGFTNDVTLGVWVGYEQMKYTLSKKSCPWAVGCGTQRAKQIWAKVMDAAIDKAPKVFANQRKTPRPSGVIDVTVSSYSGKLPNENTSQAGKVQTDIFNKKFAPTEEDNVLVKAKYVTYNGIHYLANPATPDDMVQEKVMIKRDPPLSVLMKEVEAALQKVPASSRKPLSHYYPTDMEQDAPVSDDPRSDDGSPPPPPTDLSLTHTGDKFNITFKPIETADVVGYRLYRSDNMGPLKKENGKVIFTGGTPTFEDTAAAGTVAAYSVTAVDIAGNESAKSKVIYSDNRASGDAPLLPPLDTGGPGSLGLPDNEAGQPQGQNTGGTGSNPGTGGKTKTAPSSPGGLTIAPKGAAVVVSWKANASAEGVTRYELYFSETENGTYRKLHSSSTTSITYYAAVANGWYRLVAINDNGTSQPSSSIYYTSSQ